jgi:hypothetical protein
VTQLEKAQLWTWAHRELGDDACHEIQQACDDVSWTPEGNKPCICGDILEALLVLP